jgi:hypothetical protein
MDSARALTDRVALGDGRFISRLALADALFRSGQLIGLGGGHSIARGALADALIRSGHLTATGQLPA